MKKLLFILLSISLSTKLSATHLAGAFIRYEVINSTTKIYKIFLEITRDCSGITLLQPDVKVYCGPNCSTLLTTLTLAEDSFRVTSQVCNTNQTSCYGGPLPGLETHYYSIIDTLPVCNIGIYTFAWSQGARNTNVINLDNPGAQDFSVYTLHKYNYNPNANFSTNTAPILLAPPVPFFYAGSNVCYSVSAIDTIDNDSLTYELVACSGSNTTGSCFNALTYAPASNPQYSFTQPFGTSIPHTFDPITGVLSFTPTLSTVGLYNFAIKIKEYRNGNLIGAYIRDLQCAIIAPPPSGGVNMSCNPSIIGNSGATINPNTNAVTAICDSLFNLNFTFPTTVGNQFTLDSNNSNIPSWLAFSIVPSVNSISITLSGTVPCGINYNSPITLNLIQTCGPAVTVPGIATVSVNFKVANTVSGLSKINERNNQLSIKPNPSKDFLQLELPSNQKIKTIQILDITGKLVSEINDFKNTKTNFLVTAHLKNSVYYLKVMTEQAIYYSKFIKE
jgi:Secretion system C-terminal sorting domain